MTKGENPYHKEFGIFSNIKFILKVMKKYSPSLLFFIPLAALLSVENRYIWSFLSKFLIDIISNHGSLKQLIFTGGIFLIIIFVFSNINAWYTSEVSLKTLMPRMKLILEKNLVTMTMPFVYTEDSEVLDCGQKASQAVAGNFQGVEGMMHVFFDIVGAFGAVIAGFSIIGTISLKIVFLMLIISFLSFFVSNMAEKLCKKKVWDPLAPWWRKRWYMNIALADFSYAKDIRMFGLKNWLTDKFKQINKTRYEAQKLNCTIWFWISVASSFFWLASQIFVYIYLIRLVFKREITIGNFTLYLASTSTFFECIMQFLNGITNLLNNSRYVDDFRSFYENENFRKNLDCSKKEILKPQKSYEFEFQNVSFKYPHAERFALKNVNIKVKAGERLAVVGLNGAGKSTFVKLLLRLYEPTEGKILLNGTDIQTYDLNSYFKIFSPVFQDVNLFAMNFAENISMKAPEDTNRQKVVETIEQSGLKEKFDSLEKGLDTQLLKVIYDDGVDLSGGQKQKLALARALYKNAPVVVLDEPTAALDALAESKLYSDFDKLIGGKTSIYISHRLSSTQFCNNVAMFKNGQLIEYGTHDSLMRQNGEYANMFKIQAQYYVENEENTGAGNEE